MSGKCPHINIDNEGSVDVFDPDFGILMGEDRHYRCLDCGKLIVIEKWRVPHV